MPPEGRGIGRRAMANASRKASAPLLNSGKTDQPIGKARRKQRASTFRRKKNSRALRGAGERHQWPHEDANERCRCPHEAVERGRCCSRRLKNRSFSSSGTFVAASNSNKNCRQIAYNQVLNLILLFENEWFFRPTPEPTRPQQERHRTRTPPQRNITARERRRMETPSLKTPSQRNITAEERPGGMWTAVGAFDRAFGRSWAPVPAGLVTRALLGWRASSQRTGGVGRISDELSDVLRAKRPN